MFDKSVYLYLKIKMDEHSFRNDMKHECDLPIPDDILTLYIQYGFWVDLRRKLRTQFLVSETDYRSKVYFKSAFVLRRERLKHLMFYYYMIHPFSSFSFFWKFVMMVIFFLILMIIPLTILSDNSHPAVFAKAILDFFCLINIVVDMNTGYIDDKYGKIVMRRHRVICYRLRHWFFFDLISSTNYDVIAAVFHLNDEYKYLRNLAFIKLLRFITIYKYFDDLCEKLRISVYKYKIFKLIILSTLVILWCTSIIFVVLEDDEYFKALEVEHNLFLLYCFKYCIRLMINMGLERKAKNKEFLTFESIGILIGFILQIIFISQIIQIINKSNYSQRKYYQFTQQLYEFMCHKKLPNNIRKRIFMYFNYRFQQNYYKECELLGHFSEQLQQEMMLHTHMYMLENVDMFNLLPTSVLYKLVSHMTSQVFLPSDVIVAVGSPGDCMLFIVAGTAAIYTSAGKEVCHLSDGAHFGELSLVLESEHRIASVVAVDVCEVLVLQRKDFQKEIEKFPGINDRIRKMAHDKVRRTIVHGDDSPIKSSTASFSNFDTSKSVIT